MPHSLSLDLSSVTARRNHVTEMRDGVTKRQH